MILLVLLLLLLLLFLFTNENPKNNQTNKVIAQLSLVLFARFDRFQVI